MFIRPKSFSFGLTVNYNVVEDIFDIINGIILGSPLPPTETENYWNNSVQVLIHWTRMVSVILAKYIFCFFEKSTYCVTEVALEYFWNVCVGRIKYVHYV